MISECSFEYPETQGACYPKLSLGYWNVRPKSCSGDSHLKRLPIAIVLIFACAMSNAVLRRVNRLTYSELLEQSDVVIVVRPGLTRGAIDGDPIAEVEDKSDLRFLVPVVTPVKVLAVMKGQCKDADFLFPHFRANTGDKETGLGIMNGPCLVDFHEPLADTDDGYPRGDDFIFFLKKNKNGTLTFVTGQFDAMYSVFQFGKPGGN